jgi:hypothetical protein
MMPPAVLDWARWRFRRTCHYGLMSLSPSPASHYPGITIIDVPPEISGEAEGDKEDFIVEPFIDLLSKDTFEGAQFIITGASLAGLQHVNHLHLTMVHAP